MPETPPFSTVSAHEPTLRIVPNPERMAAEGLGTRLQGLTAARSQLDHEFLTVLAEFDAIDGWHWFDGVTSTAHWLSWACSIAPGTAREHIRVARALVQLPKVSTLMADGQLTYSKVREISRLVPTRRPAATDTDRPQEEPPEPTPAATPPLDEDRICSLALEMTASQLARTVRAFRNLPGNRVRSEAKRSLSWRTRDDGLTELRVLLPAEEAATIRAAIDTAQSSRTEADVPAGTPDELSDKPLQPALDALLDVATIYLAGDHQEPTDDHHLVTVLVGAETLAASTDVPAGTSSARCEVTGGHGIEAETARRIACDAKVMGALVDHGTGDVLNLGRTKRVVTRAQRRALGIRDEGHCQFPDCTRRRWLKAHHVVHWANGGPTDLPNLMLLCHFHHMCLHEGGMTVHREDDNWVFLLPDGEPILRDPPQPDEAVLRTLGEWADREAKRPDSGRVFPPHGGHGFLLHECVGVLDQPGVVADPKDVA